MSQQIPWASIVAAIEDLEVQVKPTQTTSFAADVLTAASINTGALTSDAFAAGALTASAIAASAITSAKFASGAIDAAAIAADAIGASEFAQGAADKLWDTTTRALTDKSGFSLTAGSYSVRASSNQRGTVTITDTNSSNTATITSVTTTRAKLMHAGHNAGTSVSTDNETYVVLTNGTIVTVNRGGTVGAVTTAFEVEELF